MKGTNKQTQSIGKKWAKIIGGRGAILLAVMLAGAMLLAPVQNADAFPISNPDSLSYEDNGFKRQPFKDKAIWVKVERADDDGSKIYTAIDEDNNGRMSRGDIIIDQWDNDRYGYINSGVTISRINGRVLDSGDRLGREMISEFSREFER
jgi:hypothetical protein